MNKEYQEFVELPEDTIQKLRDGGWKPDHIKTDPFTKQTVLVFSREQRMPTLDMLINDIQNADEYTSFMTAEDVLKFVHRTYGILLPIHEHIYERDFVTLFNFIKDVVQQEGK